MRTAVTHTYRSACRVLHDHGALLAFVLVVVAGALGIWKTREIAATQQRETNIRVAQQTAVNKAQTRIIRSQQQTISLVCKRGQLIRDIFQALTLALQNQAGDSAVRRYWISVLAFDDEALDRELTNPESICSR